MADDKESFLEHLEHEVEDFVHAGEKDAKEAEPVLSDVVDVAETVDPNLKPVITEAESVAKTVEADAETVVDDVDPTAAPVASVPTTTSVGTEPSFTAPTAPVAESTEPEPAPEPEPEPAATQVLPTTTFHDTREVQAAKTAGVLPGLSDAAHRGLADVEDSIAAVKKWILFAEDGIRRVKNL